MKICSRCNKERPDRDFYKWKTKCRECLVSLKKEYRKENPDKISKHRNNYLNTKRGRLAHKKSRKKWYKTKRGQAYKRYERTLRRKAVRLATPKWADRAKIRILYEKAMWLEQLTGLKYHVDHIIPLKGEGVCGLHCWENLQILEASINIKKGNRV